MLNGATEGYNEWSIEEIQKLSNNYETLPVSIIKDTLLQNRSIKAITHKANRLNLFRHWSEKEVEKLIDVYTTATANELINMFPNRSLSSITQKANQLGLTKNIRFDKRKWSESEDKVIRQYYGKIENKVLMNLLLDRSWKAIVCRAGILKVNYYPPIPKELTEEQYQVIIGSLLGDGHCSPKGSLGFDHKEADKEYLMWKYKLLEPFCLAQPYRNVDRRGNSVIFAFFTRSSPIFKDLRKKIYPKNIKICPQEELYKLNNLGLAIWIQDDGTYNQRRIRINTLSFTKNEHYIMQEYFRDMWNLTPTFGIHSHNKYALSFSEKNTKKLIEIIKPHIVPCMKRKIGGNSVAC